jgi:hypothetical protein
MRIAIAAIAVCFGAAGAVGAAPAGWQHYTDPKLGYSVDFPPGWKLDTQYAPVTPAADGTITGVAFDIPESITTGTNLAADDTLLAVESMAGHDCKPGQFVDPADNVHTLKANGRTYVAATSEDAGVGNFHDASVFVIAGTSPCIAVRYLVHSTNLGAYDPGTVKAYDAKALVAAFDGVRATLRLKGEK